MNPCKICIKAYSISPCTDLGHCVFEGTNEDPLTEIIVSEKRLSTEHVSFIQTAQ